MRSAASFVAGALALLALLVTVPVGWVATHVASEDGYVSFTRPLASDPAFREAVADYLASEIVTRTGVPAELQSRASEAIASAGARVAERDGYVAAWAETQRRSHRLVFSDPRNLAPEQDSTDRFTVDLAPMAAYVLDEAGRILPVPVEAPDQLLVQIEGRSRSGLVQRIADTPGQATLGLVAVLVLAGAAIALARRRTTAVAWLGAGAVAAAGVLKLVADQAVTELVARNTPPTPFAATMQRLLLDRSLSSLHGWLVWLAIAGAVVAVAGIAGRAVLGRSPSRSDP